MSESPDGFKVAVTRQKDGTPASGPSAEPSGGVNAFAPIVREDVTVAFGMTMDARASQLVAAWRAGARSVITGTSGTHTASARAFPKRIAVRCKAINYWRGAPPPRLTHSG